jgi:3-dehydroquinate synthase
MTEVTVRTRNGRYPVLISTGLLQGLPKLLTEHVGADRFAIISDSNVAPLYGEELLEATRAIGLETLLFTFPAGEAFKTRKTWSILTDDLLEAGFGRDSCVVAVGGGVTTDLAGFVAATFLRGVPVVQVPTSYLAMIDASVGGKTGVDAKAGKNLVGAFHPPALVVADPHSLVTLPKRERAEGLVEAFKHGAILDEAYFEQLNETVGALLDANTKMSEEAVCRSVELKAAVVSEDELESGYRQILNFGHTLGHALEAASNYRLGHGKAVALGMVLEAELGERLGVTDSGTREHLEVSLQRLLGPTSETLNPAESIQFLASDKKARAGKPRVVLLKKIGQVDPGDGWSHELPEQILEEVFAAVLGAP